MKVEFREGSPRKVRLKLILTNVNPDKDEVGSVIDTRFKIDVIFTMCEGRTKMG